MTRAPRIDDDTRQRLVAVYEEVIWLAKRPNRTAANARAWYTHVMSQRLRLKLRRFTGKVSRKAVADPDAELRLEHHLRIQTTLTDLVASQIANGKQDADAFVRTVVACESVHIVTFKENYEAMKAKGDYALAGIKLVEWSAIPLSKRQKLWGRMLNRKVANASEFEP